MAIIFNGKRKEANDTLEGFSEDAGGFALPLVAPPAPLDLHLSKLHHYRYMQSLKSKYVHRAYLRQLLY
jgi:hypothetical protein